jgi:hypothetical protein
LTAATRSNSAPASDSYWSTSSGWPMAFATGAMLGSHVEGGLWYAVRESVDFTLIAADNSDDWAALADAPTIAPGHQKLSAEL